MSNLEVMRGELEKVLIQGDLAKLSEAGRLDYVKKICELTGLNILLKPFDYITFQGKLVLYTSARAAEQLRQIHKISISLSDKQILEGIYLVSAKALAPDGRYDEATGAIAIDSLKGLERANAMMKGETKAKRRATLSICGLSALDEPAMDQPSEPKDVGPELFSEDDRAQEINILLAKFRTVGVSESDIRGKYGLKDVMEMTENQIKELYEIGSELKNKRTTVALAFAPSSGSF